LDAGTVQLEPYEVPVRKLIDVDGDVDLDARRVHSSGRQFEPRDVVNGPPPR
jgi:hypothetical protein